MTDKRRFTSQERYDFADQAYKYLKKHTTHNLSVLETRLREYKKNFSKISSESKKISKEVNPPAKGHAAAS
jgi:hypothetical protein